MAKKTFRRLKHNLKTPSLHQPAKRYPYHNVYSYLNIDNTSVECNIIVIQIKHEESITRRGVGVGKAFALRKIYERINVAH